ncbi:MAG: GNAT family N-acetyltransferase [Ekhidna sp.]
MIDINIHIEPANRKEIPFDLLELADPSRVLIDSYLEAGRCFVASLESKIIGVIVLKEIDSTTVEIKNIAVQESEQGKGIGTKLLRYAHQISVDQGCEKLMIGTGNSSVSQLALYQKEGFEIERIDSNFFIRNYENPIFENGIQCKDMIILVKNLNN